MATMTDNRWHDLGPIEELRKQPLRQIAIGRTKIALSCRDERAGRKGCPSGMVEPVAAADRPSL